jgi:putative ABC transport system permease protein
MLELTFLAVRNVFRNVRRSVITLLSIAVGTAALACFGAFISYTFEGLRETTIRSELGHLQIYAEGYWENRLSQPGASMITDPDAVGEALSKFPGVIGVSGRVGLMGLGGKDGGSVMMQITGIDVAREHHFADFEIITRGRGLRAGDHTAGIVGEELARALDLSIDEWVTVLTNTHEGMISAFEFQVVGVTRSGSRDLDSVLVKIPLSLAQQALDTTAVDRVIVMLDDTAALSDLRPRIEAALAALPGVRFETRSWQELADFYESVVALYSGFFRTFAIMIGAVVLVSVANTMTMAVMERIGEIGALRAIGAPRRVVLSMLLQEGLVIGVIGGLAGLALAWLIALAVSAAGGIPMSPPPSMTRGYDAFLTLDRVVVLQAFSIAVVAAFLSAVYPAVAASRIRITEALQK